jgi:hypothetical protein
MPAPALLPVRRYQPVTFAERGVLVPFTTPSLAGARARPAPRGGPELLLPNPAGGRGVYVLPWSGMGEFCRPTVHDRRLNQKVQSLLNVTPTTIRHAAREVATEGLAGREAQVAAAAAAEQEERTRALIQFVLLVALLDRVEPRGRDVRRFTEPVPDLQAYARRTVIERAARLGIAGDRLVGDLAQLAEVLSAIGVHGAGDTSRVLSLMDQLYWLRDETAAWARQHRDESGEIAGMVTEVAGLTLTCAASTVREAQAVTLDALELVRRWRTDPDRVKRLAARPEWLLDGWEQICLLWRDADLPGAREAALTEMAALVPVLPQETCEWAHLPPHARAQLTYRRSVAMNEDWRTGGSSIELVQRNERLRARSI